MASDDRQQDKSMTIAVIGASRGIGKELVKQLAEVRENTVIASTRASPIGIEGSNVKSINLDVTDDASIAAAAKKVAELDLLIVNAAMGKIETLLGTSSEELISYLNTNVVGPNRIIKAFLPALLAGKTRKIIVISSDSGSIEVERGTSAGFNGPYSVSKAALNMLAVQYHNELHDQGFIVVPMHPGWVATEMGNMAGSGAMRVEDSVKAMLKVIGNLKVEDSAKFLKYDGTIVPW